MPQISTFADAQNALRPFYQNTLSPYTLDGIRELLTFLDNPQEKIRVVHIAGTSGKTSTAYYCAALLTASGKSTGLSVSPHVDTINERLQINGQPLPEDEFCAVLSEFLELIAGCSVKPSYFELLTALAYWEFARRKLDFAVMEVGLGGLLDATNTVSRADKACIITDIGLDHTEVLGDTIPKIAAQKAGIIQPGNQVYMYDQGEEVMSVVRTTVATKRATLYEIVPNATSMPAELPLFQQRNLGLAVSAINSVLYPNAEGQLSSAAVLAAAHVVVPARLEQFKVGDKTVIVDGSHNYQKLETMFTSLHELYPEQPVAVLCGFVAGNDERWQGGLKVLLTNCSHVIFTSFHSEQDFPKSSVSTDELVKFTEQQAFRDYTIEPDASEAFNIFLQRPEPVLLVTGSFYLLNHIRPLLKEQL